MALFIRIVFCWTWKFIPWVLRNMVLERRGTHTYTRTRCERSYRGKSWIGDDGERLPRSHSEWCILWRADNSALSQAELRVLRLIQNLRGHLRNNVAFRQSSLMKLRWNIRQDIRVYWTNVCFYRKMQKLSPNLKIVFCFYLSKRREFTHICLSYFVRTHPHLQFTGKKQ